MNWNDKDDNEFEKWLADDGFKGHPEKNGEKKYLFTELNRLKEKFRKDIHDSTVLKDENDIPYTPAQIYKLIEANKIRIDKVRLMIEHQISIVKNLHQPTGIKYVVARTYWIDNAGKKFKKFAKNLGAEDKVYVKGKIPLSILDNVERELDEMMWKQYKIDYKIE